MTAVPEVQRYVIPEKPEADDGVPFVPLTTMVNVFLEEVVQPNFLPDLELRLGRDFSNTTELEESFSQDKSQWEIYTLGFIMLLVFGVLLAVTLLVLGPIVTFCLIKDVGPFRRKLTLRPSILSRSSWLIFGVLVVIVTILMLLVVIPMFAMSVWIRYHGEFSMFTKLTTAVETLSLFLAKTAEELQAKSLSTIAEARSKASDLLNVIPHMTVSAFDMTTKNEMSKNAKRLHKLGTQELPKLEANLEDAMSMISASKTMESAEEAGRPSSQIVAGQRLEIAQKLATLLTVVKMATTNGSKTIQPGSKPLAQQMSEADIQLQILKGNMAKLMNNPVTEVNQQMDKTETAIKAFVDTATSISKSLTSVIDNLHLIQDTIAPPINGIFAFLVIVLLILFAITVLHLTAFVLYFPYWLPTYKTSRRNRLLRTGKTLFRVVVYTILLTAWLYWTIAALFMYFAGQVHTEVCRHLVYPQALISRRVILILDSYLTNKLFQDSPQKRFSILETYAQCEKDKPIYIAGKVQTLWNFNDMFDLSGLRNASNDLQNININPNQLNLLSTEMKAIMLRLEDLHHKIDIAGMSQMINASAMPAISTTNADTQISDSTNIHEHHVKLANKLNQIAYDMSSHDFGNLSRGLEENQNTVRTKGDEITRAVTTNISTGVYNIFSTAVLKIQFEVENNIGHCRSLYDALKSAIEEPCIQVIYPINGFWFSLGIANLLLIPIFITSCKLSDFLEPFQSQEKLPSSKAVKPQQKMAEETQNLNSPSSTRLNPPEKMATETQNLESSSSTKLKPPETQNLNSPSSTRLKTPVKMDTENQNLNSPSSTRQMSPVKMDTENRNSHSSRSRRPKSPEKMATETENSDKTQAKFRPHKSNRIISKNT